MIIDAAEFENLVPKRHLASRVSGSPHFDISPFYSSTPTMPVPSSASSSAPTPMSYDRFKPKFPLDPFVNVEQTSYAPPARMPWTLDVDLLSPPSILQLEQRVILIIGQPTFAALLPLFTSRHLASSLLIIASHRPPHLPSESYPAVRTLRLRAALAIADAGATRLIDVLEWALQVARLWRRTSGPKMQELMEEVSPGPESVRLGQSFGRLRYSVALDVRQEETPALALKPSASTTSLVPPTGKRSIRQSLFRRQSALSLVPESENVKPFDALLHFLPADVSDKAKLKAAILVTTLTRPYLATPPTRSPPTRFYSDSSPKLSRKSGKRWSLFRGSSALSSPANSSTLSVPMHSMSTSDLTEEAGPPRNALSTVALVRARRSRLIHLMPSAPAKAASPPSSRVPAVNLNYNQAQAHLIRSIEAFLLSFCFSGSAELPPPIAGFALREAESAKARPYVLPATALTEVIHIEGDSEDDEKSDRDDEENGEYRRKRRSKQLTLAEIVLSGALEGELEMLRTGRNSGQSEDVRGISNEVEKGKEKQVDNECRKGNAWVAHRAWVGSVRDVVVVRGSIASSSSFGTEVKPLAHTVPSRSSSQPVLPYMSQTKSQANAQAPSYVSSSTSSSHPSARLQFPSEHHPHSQPEMHVKPGQYPTRSPQINGQTRSLSSRRYSRSEKGKGSWKPSGAMEKRLPTPPEDEDGELREVDDGEAKGEESEESEEAETAYATSSSDTTTTRAVSGSTERLYVASRTSERKREREGEKDDSPQVDSRSYVHSPLSRQSARGDFRDYSRHVQSRVLRSRSRTSTLPAVTAPSNAVERQSSRYESSRTSSSRYGVYRSDTEKEGVERGAESLPTPPDSEEASLEDSPAADDGDVLDSSAVCHKSGRRKSSSRDRARDGWRRDRPKEVELNPDAGRAEDSERDRERERRRRTHSYPSRPPSSASQPAPAERAPPRRARTRPKENPTPVPVEKSSNRSDRRAEKLSAQIQMQAMPEIKRTEATSASGRSQSAEKPPRPGMKRNTSSEERQMRLKRVPVPSLDDVLPSLPPQSRGANESQMGLNNVQSHLEGDAATIGPEQPHPSSKKHAKSKWKFWKARADAVVNV